MLSALPYSLESDNGGASSPETPLSDAHHGWFLRLGAWAQFLAQVCARPPAVQSFREPTLLGEQLCPSAHSPLLRSLALHRLQAAT